MAVAGPYDTVLGFVMALVVPIVSVAESATDATVLFARDTASLLGIAATEARANGSTV